MTVPCPFCDRRPSVVRVSARGDVGRASTYSCRQCAPGPATDWLFDEGVTEVEIVALPGADPAARQHAQLQLETS